MSAIETPAGASYADEIGWRNQLRARWRGLPEPERIGIVVAVEIALAGLRLVLAGGKGTLTGPVVGAVIVVFLEEYLRDFKELRFSIFGLIVVAVVIFLPRGLMGFVGRRRETYQRKAVDLEGGRDEQREQLQPTLKPASLNGGGAADA